LQNLRKRIFLNKKYNPNDTKLCNIKLELFIENNKSVSKLKIYNKILKIDMFLYFASKIIANNLINKIILKSDVSQL